MSDWTLLKEATIGPDGLLQIYQVYLPLGSGVSCPTTYQTASIWAPACKRRLATRSHCSVR